MEVERGAGRERRRLEPWCRPFPGRVVCVNEERDATLYWSFGVGRDFIRLETTSGKNGGDLPEPHNRDAV